VNDDAIAEAVRRINDVADRRGVVYVAGGGSEIFPMLLARGGGSSTLLAGRVVYAPDDFRSVLGYHPDRFVDARSARGLAMAAFRHALAIRGDLAPEKVFGIGSTAKLATGPAEREGRSHEIHVAIQDASATSVNSITLTEGQERAWEERINALLLLGDLAFIKQVDVNISLKYDGRELLLAPSNSHCRLEHADSEIVDLMLGRRGWVGLKGPAKEVSGFSGLGHDLREPPRVLFPGSFRPLHAGHLAMAEAATRLAGMDFGYELSLFHPEKHPLDYISLRSRLKTFETMTCRICLTNAPTYVEKARLFPGRTFVIGHDTALRIVDPRFYGGPTARDAMLDELERLGTRFLVFGRIDASGVFRDFSADEFEHPVSGFLGRLAIAVPGDAFRMDLSSTEIRMDTGWEDD
jgi:hypothetical protein